VYGLNNMESVILTINF